MVKEILIEALRCSATVPTKEKSCVGCPFRGLEEMTEDQLKQFDCAIGTKINGKMYWEYCDTEKMAIEAAEYIEKH